MNERSSRESTPPKSVEPRNSTEVPKPAEVMARLPLFSALADNERAEIVGRTQKLSLAANEVLFSEGEPCKGLFVIATGSVRIFKNSRSGREILLALDRAPATVAEVPAFDGGPYPASVVAVEPVIAYHIPKEELAELCRQHPEVGLKLLAVAGRRLRKLVALVHQLTFGGVRQRLAGTLLDLESQYGSPFALQTHQELANQIGSVREVISRNLSRFQSQGLIRVSHRQVWVEDVDGLREESETEMH